jgi:hypothetical protein
MTQINTLQPYPSSLAKRSNKASFQFTQVEFCLEYVPPALGIRCRSSAGSSCNGRLRSPSRERAVLGAAAELARDRFTVLAEQCRQGLSELTG